MHLQHPGCTVLKRRVLQGASLYRMYRYFSHQTTMANFVVLLIASCCIVWLTSIAQGKCLYDLSVGPKVMHALILVNGVQKNLYIIKTRVNPYGPYIRVGMK